MYTKIRPRLFLSPLSFFSIEGIYFLLLCAAIIALSFYFSSLEYRFFILYLTQFSLFRTSNAQSMPYIGNHCQFALFREFHAGSAVFPLFLNIYSYLLLVFSICNILFIAANGSFRPNCANIIDIAQSIINLRIFSFFGWLQRSGIKKGRLSNGERPQSVKKVSFKSLGCMKGPQPLHINSAAAACTARGAADRLLPMSFSGREP